MRHRFVTAILTLLLAIVPLAAAHAQGDPTPPPNEFEPITGENVRWATRIARLGYGSSYDTAWNGSTLAVASGRGVWLHDTDDLSQPPTLIETHLGATSVTFNPDGTVLTYVAGWGIHFWDVAAGQEIDSCASDENRDEVAFSPDGTHFATTGGSGALWLMSWDGSNCKLVSELEYGYSTWSYPSSNSIVQYSADGAYLAWSVPTWSYGELDSVTVKNTITGEERVYRPEPGGGFEIYINRVVLTPDDKLVIHGIERLTHDSSTSSIQAWDLATGEPVEWHIPGIPVSAVPNSDLIAVYDEGNLVLWDCAAGEARVTLTGVSGEPVFHPDGTEVFVRGENRLLRVETATGQVLDSMLKPSPDIEALALHNNHLAWHNRAGYVVIAESPFGQEIARIEVEPKEYYWLLFSPDGTQLVIAGNETVQLWGIATQQRVFETPITGVVRCLLFDSNGRLIVWTWQEDQVICWDAETREVLNTLSLPTNVRWFIFNATGTRLAIVDEDRMVHVWDTTTGEVLRTFDQLLSPNWRSIAFSPDGSLLAFAGDDDDKDMLREWDVATGQNTSIEDDRKYVGDPVKFNQDGTLLFIMTGLGERYAWDTTTGEMHALALSPRFSTGSDLTFSPDGRFFAFQIRGTVEVWGMPVE